LSQSLRDVLRLQGLIPTAVESLSTQTERVMLQIRRPGLSRVDQYQILQFLKLSNPVLFYKALIDHLEELMPVVYTPTVGLACVHYHELYTAPHGLYLSAFEHRGRIRELLANHPEDDVRIVVVTDGGRVLGLGDLGTNGMGISAGKVALYVAGGGFAPHQGLPAVLDCGTDNEGLLGSRLYLGARRRRLKGEEHLRAVEEFCDAVSARWPGCLIQFEDFQTEAAFAILQRLRRRCLCFNDDIQGTGAITLAGIINGLKVQGTPLKELRAVFYGAGSSACGVAEMIVRLLMSEGLTEADARAAIFMVDTKGLVTDTRPGRLPPHKAAFARTDGARDTNDLGEVIAMSRPHALIGLAGGGPAWTQVHIEELCRWCDRPLIFPLSNPTSQAEITAEQAYRWTRGSCVFASGSPFEPVELDGSTYYPGQCNNVFVFPGIGLGSVSVGASCVTDEFLLAAARAVADTVGPEMLSAGRVYPKLTDLRDVSLAVAVRVAACAIDEGVARESSNSQKLERLIQSNMWAPEDLSVAMIHKSRL